MESYQVIAPSIPTGQIYQFVTDYDIEYEVRFGRKKGNILHAVVVFGVLNEEYEGEEYVETNKGDAFRVMTTIVKIIKMYFKEHINTQVFEFTGILRETDSKQGISQRTKLYSRYIPQTFDPKMWKSEISGNQIIVTRISNT